MKRMVITIVDCCGNCPHYKNIGESCGKYMNYVCHHPDMSPYESRDFVKDCPLPEFKEIK